MHHRSVNLADLVQPGFTIDFKFSAGAGAQQRNFVVLADRLQKSLDANFMGCEVSPLFSQDALHRLQQQLRASNRQQLATESCLTAYHRIRVPDTAGEYRLLAWLQGKQEVATAYFPGRIMGAPSMERNKITETYTRKKEAEWLCRINVNYARQFEGGTGKHARFVDIEQGWDLADAGPAVKFLPYSGISLKEAAAHGKTILDIILSSDDGIAPHACSYPISQWRSDGTPNAADAILSAIGFLHPGDCLLLELQSYWMGTGSKLWPIEIQPACFDMINLASRMGIIVVEAAGNGDSGTGLGNNLDELCLNNQHVFRRDSIQFKDSGAIMVGASMNQAPFRRLPCSNYGSRIDCFSFGDRVAPDSEKSTSGMLLTGTSAPAAIIAGAAILIQSIAEANGISRLNPHTMRSVLSNPAYQANLPDAHEQFKIGVMPDLEKIINQHLHLFPE